MRNLGPMLPDPTAGMSKGEAALYKAGLTLIWMLQALPLRWVAHIGRFGGLIGWHVARGRRRMVLNNLQMCFGAEMSPVEIRDIARENFCRVGEVFLCLVGTSAMSRECLEECISVDGLDKLYRSEGNGIPPSCVLAIGHLGNFELFAHLGKFLPGWQCMTSYRSLKQKYLDQLVLQVRSRSGCLFYERRKETVILKAATQCQQAIIGLLADQRVGKGVRLPFLGRACFVTRAPAVFALRYRARLFPAICYRTGLAQWRLEIGDEIPTRHDGTQRAVYDIMRDVNRVFESAVRRDPVNWFWIHDRWKGHGEPVCQKSINADGVQANPVI
jgi:Kdo2-lipid IVA lauroyltransferase/acyltransferase